MIYGIGIDLIEKKRFEKVFLKRKNHFSRKTFTDIERTYCESQSDPILHYAARFAAKEAFSKALKTGIGKEVGFLDLSIANDDRGAPFFILSEAQKKKLEKIGIVKCHLSITHTHESASAYVILEKIDN